MKKLTIIPAAIGFLLLFAVNLILVFASLLLGCAGALAAPMGILYGAGIIHVVTDFTPWALVCFGAFCVFTALFLALFISRFAPYCLRLVHRFSNKLRNTVEPRIYRNTKCGFLLVVFPVVAVLALGGTIFLQVRAADGGFTGSVITERLEFDKARYITVSTNNLDYEIKHTDGDKIIVEYTNETPMIIRQSDENYLKLTQDDSFVLTLFAREQFSYKLTIYLPVYDYRELHLKSSSGAVTLASTYSEYAEIETKTGDIEISEASGKLSVKSAGGDISCDYNAFINAGTFKTTDGSIRVTMPDFSGVELEFDTTVGYFTSDFFNEIYDNEQGAQSLSRYAPLSRHLYVETESGHFSLLKNK